MRLATLPDGSPDGRLHVVSLDNARCTPAQTAPTLQAALEGWDRLRPALEREYASLNAGGGMPLDPARALAPLPRAWAWLDGSAFDTHGALMDEAFGVKAEKIPGKPLMYQGMSDRFLAPAADVPLPSEDDGIDFEGEFGVVTTAVPMGTTDTLPHIALLVQINDWSLRKLGAAEMKTRFGWIQAKPACAMAPVALTPDELGPAWQGARIHLPLRVDWNGAPFGAPAGGEAMHPAIREILVRIEATIDTHPDFDPAQSSRAFNVLVSDYSLRVLIPRVLAEMERQGARVRLNLLTQSRTPHTMLERGDADLLVSPDIFVSPDHPSQLIFEDTYVVIACAHGPHAGATLDLARYSSARHAVMVPPNTTGASVPAEERYLNELGVTRQVGLTTFSFSSLPYLVAGTGCIATVPGLLAEQSRASAGIVTFPMPFAMPPFRQMAQWHSYRDQDPGILWLRDLFTTAGATLQSY